MKATRFLMMFVAAAAMLFASCDKDDENNTNFSGSLKAIRVVLKRLPHSLRSFAMTDFYLSGSQKSTIILNEAKNPIYPHKDSSPTVQNDATAFSGSLKTSVETIPNEIPLQPVAISSEIIRQRQQGEIK